MAIPRVLRRNRRAVDPALKPENAPLLAALVWLETSNEQTASFNLLDLGLGSAVQDVAGWRMGPIDWELDGGEEVSSVELSGGTGSIVVILSTATEAFVGANYLRIPAWSQTIRGPRGEWVTGYIPIPAFV